MKIFNQNWNKEIPNFRFFNSVRKSCNKFLEYAKKTEDNFLKMRFFFGFLNIFATVSQKNFARCEDYCLVFNTCAKIVMIFLSCVKNV